LRPSKSSISNSALALGVHIFDGAVGADHANAILAGLDDAEEIDPGAFQNRLVGTLVSHHTPLLTPHDHRLAGEFKRRFSPLAGTVADDTCSNAEEI
jgi:hypothetical protein